jgi:hypothetical protein
MVINLDVKRLEQQIDQQLALLLVDRKQQIIDLQDRPENYERCQVLEGEISGIQAAHRAVWRLLELDK